MTQLLGIDVDVLAVFLSFCAVIVAIGKEVILPIWIKPEIEIIYDNNTECIQASPFRDRDDMPSNFISVGEDKKLIISQPITDSNWLRLKIVNNGNATAKKCYVKLTAIRNDSGDIIKPFDPSPLKWTVFQKDKIDLAKKRASYGRFGISTWR